MKIASLTPAMCLLLALTSACGSKSEDSSRSDKKSEDTSRSEKSSQPKEDSSPFGTFTCKAIKDSACVTPTDHFDATTEKLNVIYKTKDLPKNGDVYLIKWVADDVGTAAPPNTVIDSTKMTVADVISGVVSYTVHGELSQPTKGWPKGSYHVDVLLGEKVVTSAKFKIE